jgi:hypothetical protein
MNDVNLARVVSLRQGRSLLVYDFSRITSFGSKAHSLSLLSLARLGSALFRYDFASLLRHLSLLGAILNVNFGAPHLPFHLLASRLLFSWLPSSAPAFPTLLSPKSSYGSTPVHEVSSHMKFRRPIQILR